jgi:transposase-like protein
MVSFSGRHYPKFIILQCVRWYVAYALSYRNIEEMMAERGFEMDHATLNRWVLHYAPLLEKKAKKYKLPIHRSWRMDETYIKIKGKWHYLYRAVDKYGATVEFMVSKRRDKAAAKAFFRKAFLFNRRPLRINIDKSGSNKAALDSLNQPGWLTGRKLFHIRQVKRITNPIGCFRKMHTASRTLAGIELMNMIKKKQLKLTKHRDQNLTPSEPFYRLATVR